MFKKKNEVEPEMFSKKKGVNLFVFIIYIILGIYFINFQFNFLNIPEFIRKIDSWIIFVGGLFMLFGAFNYFKVKRK